MTNNSDYSVRKIVIFLVDLIVFVIIGGVIVGIIVGEGRFAPDKVKLDQAIVLVVTLFVLAVAFTVVMLRWESVLGWLATHMRSIVNAIKRHWVGFLLIGVWLFSIEIGWYLLLRSWIEVMLVSVGLIGLIPIGFWTFRRFTSYHRDLSENIAGLETGFSALQVLPEKTTEFEKQLSLLQNITERVTDLEDTLTPRYPHHEFNFPAFEYGFADILDSPFRSEAVIMVENEKICAVTASCEGIERKAIYQHPFLDGKKDARLCFSSGFPGNIQFLVLTFYTGIEDSRTQEGGSIEKSEFMSRRGNEIRFQIYADKHLIFEETRSSFEWRFHALVLPASEDRSFEIEFRTNACGEPHYNWAVWGEPRLADWVAVFKDLTRLRKTMESLARQDRRSEIQVQAFKVYAHKEQGINTGLILQPGQLFRIYAVGEVSINWGETWIGPDGIRINEPGKGEYVLAGDTYFNIKDDLGPDGALLGWVDEDREASSFLIGHQCTRIAEQEGNLHLGVNDTKGAYGDNYGDKTGAIPTSFTAFVELLPTGEKAD